MRVVCNLFVFGGDFIYNCMKLSDVKNNLIKFATIVGESVVRFKMHETSFHFFPSLALTYAYRAL